MERDMLKGPRLLREGERLKFALIDAEKAKFPGGGGMQGTRRIAARVLPVALRPESRRACDDGRRAVKVRESFKRGRTYDGSPRILKDLRADDEPVSRKRVIQLMQVQGLVARVYRRYRCTTMSSPDPDSGVHLGGRQLRRRSRRARGCSMLGARAGRIEDGNAVATGRAFSERT